MSSLGLPKWLSGKESASNAKNTGSGPGLGSPGEGNGNPLQATHSYLRNLMDRGAEQATVHEVIKE